MNKRKGWFCRYAWGIAGCAAMLLGGAAMAAPAARQTAEFRQIEEAVAMQQAWVLDAQCCPADLMMLTAAAEETDSADCKAGHLEACLVRCSEGSASTCYGLAQRMEEHDLQSPAAGVLFQRACRLGSMSGCTNRAAQMMSDEKQQNCAARTFEATCGADDPWGCTMSAQYLAGGVVVERDFTRALQALDRACKFGLEDQACIYAIKLRIEIRRMQHEAAASRTVPAE